MSPSNELRITEGTVRAQGAKLFVLKPSRDPEEVAGSGGCWRQGCGGDPRLQASSFLFTTTCCYIF